MLRREREPKKWTFWASTGILAVVVAAGVTVAVVKSGAEQTPDPVPAAPTQQEDARLSGACPSGPVELDGRVDTPPASSWHYSGELAFPVPEGASVPESRVFECFTHTPSGAVLAAGAAVAQLSEVDPAVRREAITRRVAPGDVQDQMLQSVRGSSASPQPESMRLRVAGFRLAYYDGSTARVDVALTGQGQGQAVVLSMLTPLTWDEERGDWLLTYGDFDQVPPAAIPNLAGYVTWPAEPSGEDGRG